MELECGHGAQERLWAVAGFLQGVLTSSAHLDQLQCPLCVVGVCGGWGEQQEVEVQENSH